MYHIAISAKGFHEFSGFEDEIFTQAGGEDRDFCDRWLAKSYRMAYVPRR